MMRAAWVIVLGLAACSGKRAEDAPADPAAPARLVFGDCAGVDIPFVSGPRPAPFDPDALVAPRRAPRHDHPGAQDHEDDSAGSGSAVDARTRAIEQAREAGILGTLADTPGGPFASLTDTRGQRAIDPIDWTGQATIAIGSQTGQRGYAAAAGGLRGTSLDRRQVRTGMPTVIGAMDKNLIRRYLRRSAPQIAACYEQRLVGKPGLAGKLEVKFTISSIGAVFDVTATGFDKQVAACVKDVISAVTFPPGKGSGVTTVTYPLTMTPGAKSAAAGSAAAGNDAAGSAAATPTADLAADAPMPYHPGARNPLRDHEAAIARCLPKPPQHGVVVVDLSFAPTGAVTQAAAHGTPDQQTRSCIALAAQQAKRSGDGPVRQRCAFAFGTLPVGRAPGIELTATAIRWGGEHVVGGPRELAIGGTEAVALAPLTAAIALHHGAPIDPVAVRGPLVIRPLDATPMQRVNQVIAAVAAAGDLDVVFARQDGASWRSLIPLELPVVPVPVGTGEPWHGAFRGRPGVRAERRVNLSLLVAEDRVWLGSSVDREMRAWPDVGGMHDWAAIRAALDEHKRSALFLERTDVEIAGADAVTYRAVADAIAIARDAGFTDGVLVPPQALSTRPQP